jgi:hypothetical protein
MMGFKTSVRRTKAEFDHRPRHVVMKAMEPPLHYRKQMPSYTVETQNSICQEILQSSYVAGKSVDYIGVRGGQFYNTTQRGAQQ